MKKILADKDIEIIIGNLLRAGVLISSAIIIIGAIIYLCQSGHVHPDYHKFKGMNNTFYSLSYVLHGVAQLSGEHIIQLGVLILIATPVARIVFSIIGFIKEHDTLYIVITLLVLLIILSSIFFGIKA